MDVHTDTGGLAVADWMRAEASAARTDLAYAVRQLTERLAQGGVERALDALERVGEALKGIETCGTGESGE